MWKSPVDKLNHQQRTLINNWGKKVQPKVKVPKERVNYYNPNDFIHISPNEIERQFKEAMKQMIENDDRRKD